LFSSRWATRYPMSSLAKKIRDPGFPGDGQVSTDLINFGAEFQTHLAWVATSLFLQQHGRLPAPNQDADAAAVVTLAREALASKQVAIEVEVDEKWVFPPATFKHALCMQ
jgi:hypothetical protein